MLISQNLVFHFENHTYMYVFTMPFAIYIKKYLKAKEEEELWKLKYFIMRKYINLQKNPLKKEAKILQDLITL